MKDKHGLTAKIFIGCEITHDLRNSMTKSSTWKQASITWKNQGGGLEEIKKGDRSYLGCRSGEQHLSLDEFHHLAKTIKSILLAHCPDVDIEKLKIVLFPEIMVA